MQSEQKTPFFFIIGRGRSGTTLLRCLFDAHPNVNIPLECTFMVHLMKKYSNVKLLDQKKLLSFYKDVITYPKLKFWLFDQEKLKKDILSFDPKGSYIDLCRVVYQNNKSFFEKDQIAYIGDKNPSHTTHLPTLQRLIPDAKFIYLTRDHRDNSLSIIKARFEAPFITSVAYRWKFVNRKVLRFRSLYPDRFYSLRYEDMVSDPQRYLREMCEFLKIPFTDTIFNFHTKLEEVLKVYPRNLIDRHHKNLFKPISAGHIFAWKKTMTEWQVKRADYAVGSVAEELAYERKYKNPGIFGKLFILPGIVYGRLLYVFINVVDNLPYFLKRNIANFLAIIYRKDWKLYGKKKDIG